MADEKNPVIRWALVVGVPAAIVSLFVIADRFDVFGRKRPNLVAVPPVVAIPPQQLQQPAPPEWQPAPQFQEPEPQRYVPYANGMATPVTIKNSGEHEALVRSVKFAVSDRKRTPVRENMAGKGETIVVMFRSQHYSAQRREFTLHFRQPKSAPGNDEYTPLEVSIVEPNWVGWTYTGKLTVFYADRGSIDFENVELDVLPVPPPQ